LNEIEALIGPAQPAAPRTDPAALEAAAQARRTGCQRIVPLMSLLDVADGRLAAGGKSFTGTSPAPIAAALATGRSALRTLQRHPSHLAESAIDRAGVAVVEPFDDHVEHDPFSRVSNVIPATRPRSPSRTDARFPSAATGPATRRAANPAARRVAAASPRARV